MKIASASRKKTGLLGGWRLALRQGFLERNSPESHTQTEPVGGRRIDLGKTFAYQVPVMSVALQV